MPPPLGQDRTTRRLTARSVVASVLLGTRPPTLPVRTLVRTAELFGISEGTTRTAISRMLSAGELVGDGSRYRLAGPLLFRYRRQEESRHPQESSTSSWDGTWWMAVVPSGSRPAADRAELRQRMREHRMAEWREGLWVRPANLEPRGDDSGCTWVRGKVESADEADMANELWDLGGWSNWAGRLITAMDDSQPRLTQGDTAELASAFLLAAGAVRHQQADPLLPAPLLPRTWPGPRLRRRYDDYESAFQRLLREWAGR